MADITVNQVATQTFYKIPQIFITITERQYGSDWKVKGGSKHTIVSRFQLDKKR